MVVVNPRHKAIVIDTDQYAGNFERDMCAYLTGQYGDCGVGYQVAVAMSAKIKHLTWWNRYIALEMDEHGIRRPVSISPTPGWFNNGMGGNYHDVESEYERAQRERIASIIKHQAFQRKLVQDRLDTGNFEAERLGAWTKEACERHIANCEATVQRAVKQGLQRHPAHMSVAIFVKEFPPQEVMDELKERAGEFSDQLATLKGYRLECVEKIEIRGMRLVGPNAKQKCENFQTALQR